MKAGVALNPATPAEHLRYVLEDIDLVLVMSVNPGFGGQKFIHAVLPKIKAIRSMFDEIGRKDVLISVDGGIDLETAPLAAKAGANLLVAGSSIYRSPDVALAIKGLQSADQNLKAGAA